ncbi:helix-turn-helix domain-containing protein [Pseudoroseicyclus sp. H15]
MNLHATSLSITTYLDPTLQETGLRGWDQRYMRTVAGEFEGSVTRIDFGPVVMLDERMNLGVIQWSAPPPGTIVLGFMPAADNPRMNGVPVGGMAMLQRGGAEVMVNSPQHTRGVVIQLDSSAFVLPDRLFHRSPIVLHPMTAGMDDTARFIETILVSAAGNICFSPSEFGRMMGEVLVARVQRVLDEFGDSAQATPLGIDQAVRIVEQAERAFTAHQAEGLTVATMAEALHISQRQLREAFSTALSTTPREWLLLRKLDAVHRQLLKGGDQSLTRLALDSGLGHLGRFAAYYERLFGRLPSAER